MTVLELTELCHVFPDGTVGLDRVSVTFHDGELAVIAGPNGSGKSVLARHMAGLLDPTSGSVRFPELKSIDGNRIAAGLVFQDADSQIVGQTVEEDVSFGPENLRLDQAEVTKRVAESLLSVGLEGFGDHKPHHLSGGEKRRLAIAGVLAMDPHVLILDEPFSGLDYPGTIMVLETILSLHSRGHTTIVITHDIQKILAHADRLIIMKDGRIEAADTPAALIERVEAYGLRGPDQSPGCTAEQLVERMSWLK